MRIAIYIYLIKINEHGMYQDKGNNKFSFTEKPETQRLLLVWLNTTSYIQSALETVGGGSKVDRRKKANT